MVSGATWSLAPWRSTGAKRSLELVSVTGLLSWSLELISVTGLLSCVGLLGLKGLLSSGLLWESRGGLLGLNGLISPFLVKMLADPSHYTALV